MQAYPPFAPRASKEESDLFIKGEEIDIIYLFSRHFPKVLAGYIMPTC